ncbi:MAG: DHHA1 domain-containing protein [Candidatus Bathyarchaeia archaeon]
MEGSMVDSLKLASKKILKYTTDGAFIRAISHLDADGLAAAGILGTALMRLDSPYRIRIARAITPRLIGEIADEEPPIVVFSDLGSGYMDTIKEGLNSKTEVVIIDHHRPTEAPIPSNVIHVNPRLFGFDSGHEISGAGIAYLLANTLDEKNDDLAYLAIVGALGDLQDKDRKLHSINRVIAERAVRNGFLEITEDLLLYGRETRPLSKALAYTANPFLPGLTGKEDRCVAILQSSGIPLKKGGRWRTVAGLSEDEKRKLLQAIVRFIAPKGEDVFKLIGEVYTLTHEEPLTPFRNAREFSTLLNACSRMKNPGLALSICLGSRRGSLKQADDITTRYRRKLAAYLDWATEGNVREMENAYILDGREVIMEDLIGTVTSISTSIFSDKVVIGFARAEEEEGMVKVSARIGENFTGRDVNVGEVVIEAAVEAKGQGGGHEAAAGAYIPEENMDGFVERCNKLLGS